MWSRKRTKKHVKICKRTNNVVVKSTCPKNVSQMIIIQVALSWPLAATGGQNIILLWNVGNKYILTHNVHKKFIGIFLIHRQIQLKSLVNFL